LQSPIKFVSFNDFRGKIPPTFTPETQVIHTMSTQHNSVLIPVASRSEIEELLGDILQSAPFRTSRQCQDLFRYVVEHSLNGSDESLRERAIGIDVFGRAPDYDTAEDPVVRLRAADVRKRLAQYYQAKADAPALWKIEIPTGSYRAHFHPSDAIPVVVPSAHSAIHPIVENVPSTEEIFPSPVGVRKKGKWFWITALVAGCLALISMGMVLARGSGRAQTPLDLFWGPILETSRPVLVCTGSNRVYILSMEARNRYRTSHPSTENDTRNLEMLVPKQDLKKFTGDEFVPVRDTYLTVGDASATAQISALMTSRHHPYDLRFGSDLSFGDLRSGSAVLIGAFNNSWTLNMTDNLRFVFDAGDTPRMHVQDRFDASRSWWPKLSEDGKFSEDYAIVSRVLDSKTGAVLITIAGLDQTGTRAAGDFVTNPQLIAEVTNQAPKDWARKNIQIVLHTNVVNNIPSSASVSAVHYW
jgi:hypothetical protein